MPKLFALIAVTCPAFAARKTSAKALTGTSASAGPLPLKATLDRELTRG